MILQGKTTLQHIVSRCGPARLNTTLCVHQTSGFHIRFCRALVVLGVLILSAAACGTKNDDASDSTAVDAGRGQADGVASDAMTSDAVTGDVVNGNVVNGDVGLVCDTMTDCRQIGSFCENAICTAPQPCATDKACGKLGAVCVKKLGVCAACVTADDCSVGESCKAYRCFGNAAPCTSSKECSALSQVCDKTAKECVGCVDAADCDTDDVCLQNVCIRPLCSSADDSCLSKTSVRRCRSDGIGFETTTCGSKQLCKAAACKDIVCVPGSKRCATTDAGDGKGPAAKGLQVCDVYGLRWSESVPCASGDACVAGKCQSSACKPGASACMGGAASVCKSDGSGWDKQDCAVGTSCTLGANGANGASCSKQVCTPGASACVGNKVSTCNGSGLIVAISDDCDAPATDGKKRVCVGGACLAAACQSGQTQCAADGKLLTCQAVGGSWKSSDCGSGKTCSGGGCVAQTCIPKTSKCGGKTILTCNTQGTDYEIGDDCSKQSDVCGVGVCKAGKCVVTPTDCDDTNSCTKDGCDTATGCTHNKLNNVACDDGDGCSVADQCVAGICQAGTAKVCDDNNDCTADSCIAKTGCVSKALAAGTACTSVAGGSCTAGVCKSACAGGEETWTKPGKYSIKLPGCASSVKITAAGAAGGGGRDSSPTKPDPSKGGLGATIVAIQAITGGQTVTIIVGGQGLKGSSKSSSGGGGGGCSAVFVAGSQKPWVVAAAGGGGAGGSNGFAKHGKPGRSDEGPPPFGIGGKGPSGKWSGAGGGAGWYQDGGKPQFCKWLSGCSLLSVVGKKGGGYGCKISAAGTADLVSGGFGGGGCSAYGSGGGGAGWSGGNGGYSLSRGFGGTSYAADPKASKTGGVNAGDGKVTLKWQ